MMMNSREITRWCCGSLTTFDYGRRYQKAVLFQPSALAEFRGWTVMPFATLREAKRYFRERTHHARFAFRDGAPVAVWIPVDLDQDLGS